KLLIANHEGIRLLDLQTLRIQDTLYNDRATALCLLRDTVFAGKLDGLYGIANDRSVHFYGDKVPFLRRRISAITSSPDGTMWIGSYDGGVIGYRDGKVIASFSKAQGLTSNICRTLFYYNNTLWIGTDKGLNRISLDQPGYPINRYSSQDGLGSDLVNNIYADGSVIYVGTSAGLSYFDETRVNISEGCRLYLLSVQNSGRERIGDSASLQLPYIDKHLRLEFAGISYRSVGDITYRYRLTDLDTAWRTTKETYLEYPTLPSGSYRWQLQAVNKFGQKSDVLTLNIEVATPWWQTFWFEGLVLLAILCLAWLLASLRIRRIRNRQREKEQVSQRMMELEHTALQSQMNPHFIFNCLNSIQQYIFDQDIFAANKYLTGFSKLIRATLQNSSKPFILLSEEIGYLSGYLSLEKLRFKDKMDYTIVVDPTLQGSDYLVPPMLIQPYVENSMRHGLRHKTQGKGTILIRFRHEGHRLSVTVEDNGIGRKGAAAFKTREHIEYQSKGMSLTADRIRMINARYNDPIRVEVIDLEDDAGRPAGTRVVMEFPLFHLISENETI
ncbi:MAG TPA: histidine kinase, partial [Puia sp.]